MIPGVGFLKICWLISTFGDIVYLQIYLHWITVIFIGVTGQLSCGDTCKVWMWHFICKLCLHNLKKLWKWCNSSKWFGTPNPTFCKQEKPSMGKTKIPLRQRPIHNTVSNKPQKDGYYYEKEYKYRHIIRCSKKIWNMFLGGTTHVEMINRKVSARKT